MRRQLTEIDYDDPGTQSGGSLLQGSPCSRLTRQLQQRFCEPSEEADPLTHPLWERSQKNLGSDLLEVELNSFQPSPPAPPSHLGDVLRLQVQVRSP